MVNEGKSGPDPKVEAEGQFLWSEEAEEQLPQKGLSFGPCTRSPPIPHIYIWTAVSSLLPIFILYSDILNVFFLCFSNVISTTGDAICGSDLCHWLPVSTRPSRPPAGAFQGQGWSRLIGCSPSGAVCVENWKTIIIPGQSAFYCYHAPSILNNASNRSTPTCGSRCAPSPHPCPVVLYYMCWKT